MLRCTSSCIARSICLSLPHGVRECGSRMRATCMVRVEPPETMRPPRSSWPPATHDRHRVDARMAPEPAVFVGQQRLQVQRRNAVDRGRIAPHALGIGECTQWRAVGSHHQGAGIALFRQRRWEGEIQHQQQRQRGGRAPAQPWPQRPQPAAQRRQPGRHRVLHCRLPAGRAAPPRPVRAVTAVPP